MEKIKAIMFKLFWHHSTAVIFLATLSATMLLYSYFHPEPVRSVCYISYAVSSYSFICLIFKIPDAIEALRSVSVINRRIILFTNDPLKRVELSLYVSSASNILYALLHFYLGVTNRSIWFYALASYYASLTAIRLLLLRRTRKHDDSTLKKEFVRYRLCGVLLSNMNIAMAVVVFYIVRQNRGFVHGEIVAITLAAFTCFSLILSITGIFRYRKYESPIMMASKMVSLAASAVSLLSLETTLITAFGQDAPPIFRKIVTASTGSLVCILILVLSAYMITHSTRELKRLEGKGK